MDNVKLNKVINKYINRIDEIDLDLMKEMSYLTQRKLMKEKEGVLAKLKFAQKSSRIQEKYKGDVKNPKPGDKITVQLGEYTLETFIDQHGVQRFSPLNQEYADLYNSGSVDLNEMARNYGNGKITLKYYREFYLSIGYSVSGLTGLSFFQKLEVHNPLWEK